MELSEVQISENVPLEHSLKITVKNEFVDLSLHYFAQKVPHQFSHNAISGVEEEPDGRNHSVSVEPFGFHHVLDVGIPGVLLVGQACAPPVDVTPVATIP